MNAFLDRLFCRIFGAHGRWLVTSRDGSRNADGSGTIVYSRQCRRCGYETKGLPKGCRE